MYPVDHHSRVCQECHQPFSNQSVVKFKENLAAQDLAVISKGGQTPTQVKCGHIFHSSCLHKWIGSFGPEIVFCSICEQDLTDEAVSAEADDLHTLAFHALGLMLLEK